MLYFVMFVIAVCILILLKLKWPQNKSFYDKVLLCEPKIKFKNLGRGKALATDHRVFLDDGLINFTSCYSGASVKKNSPLFNLEKIEHLNSPPLFWG